MHRRNALILISLGFATAWIASQGVGSPGYMDADYYYTMGKQWASGQAAQEPFLWNYLSQPETIPTLSHGYWSPLTSIIIGFFLRLFGAGFPIAQLPFIIFTSLLPYLVWWLALAMGSDPDLSFQAGLLALAPGYFLPYFVTTDVFSLYALLGVLLMLVLQIKLEGFTLLKWNLAGILVGLAHLSRADGFLLILIPITLMVSYKGKRSKQLGLLMLGYLIVMTPWFYRNLITSGSLLNPAGGRTLWLLSYDEIFSYPAHLLSPERWWAAGLGQIMSHRWSAATTILQRIVGENGLIFLAPLMLIGIRMHWKEPLVRAVFAYLIALLIVMVLIFPFAGARGGWFHSSVAAMPLLWIMAPYGLKASIEWVGSRREWDLVRAKVVFGYAMICMALLFTWGLYAYRVVGSNRNLVNWDLPQARYELIRDAIQTLDPDPGVVAINNPPGFYQVSGMKAVSLPNGDLTVLEQVVEKFGISWIVLDINHPEGLKTLFTLGEIPGWMKLERSLEIYGETFVLYRVLEA